MMHSFSDRIFQRSMTRRDFLRLMYASGVSVAASVSLMGCAVDPVTGKSTFLLMSEQQEIGVDKDQSPYQFSADYGELQDTAVNGYISDVGNRLAQQSHRPHMPYSYRCVNATHANAYAFPGGSIAVTRGILVELENEAELAALLGHEIGHVNARHAAERATRSMLAEMILASASTYVQQSEYSGFAGLFEALGNVSAGALLAHYSRENEREADALGMEYMTRVGHNPGGMVGLMDTLRQTSKHKPSSLELMFATHPMSDERYETAATIAHAEYGSLEKAPYHRERFMDNTARVRQFKGAIQRIQTAQSDMNQSRPANAEAHLIRALKVAPNDYTALVVMAKCQLAQERPKEAARYAEHAKYVNPNEAQGYHVAGVAKIMQNNFSEAYQDFAYYDSMLPGNPNTSFLKGVALEGMQDTEGAAQEYYRFLQTVKDGWQAQHAYKRLVAWGYLY